MNKIALSMSVALAAMLCAPSASAQPLKVLMIGNSFSHCILEEWPRCAASAGDTLDLASLFIGGCSLSKHWENVEKSSDPDFMPYVFAWNYASAKDKASAPVARLGGKTNIPQALVADNLQRHRVHPCLPQVLKAVRVTVLSTWGDPSARLFEVRLY